MASRETPVLDQVLQRLLKVEKPNSIGDGGAVLARTLGHVFLGEIELFHKSLKRASLLDRIQVFALYILNKRNLERQLWGDFPNHSGDPREPCPLGSAPAALSGDKLVSPSIWSQNQGLYDPICANRARQFFEGLFPEASPRLVGARVDEVSIHVLRPGRASARQGHGGANLRLRLGLPNQSAQTPAQSVSGHWQ